MPSKLCTDTLMQLRLDNPEVQLPTHLDATPAHYVCHVGVGGFHRGHQALYLQEVNDLLPDDQQWAICGIGLLKKDKHMKMLLQNQSYLYSVISQDQSGSKVAFVNTIDRFLLLDDGIDAILEFMADPKVKIVSMTVTESGYCQNEFGNVDFENPRIQDDVANPGKPKTVVGLLTAALKLRLQNDVPPFTVMCCDNLQENGVMLKKLVLEYARKIDQELEKWIAANVTFPNSMVDRITPVTETKHVEIVESNFGIIDGWPVICEGFRQWVLEDHFCNERPPFEKVGVQLVDDVTDFELAKLRLLNGAHSALAYISHLAGFSKVHDAMGNPAILRFVQKYMDELTPSLEPVPGMDFREYKSTLVARFQNSKIADTIDRLCLDGSSKLANFVQDAVFEISPNFPRLPAAELAIAGWMRYLANFEENIPAVLDKNAGQLVPIACNLLKIAQNGQIPDVKAFLALVLPKLAELPNFCAGVSKSFAELCTKPCLDVVSSL